MLFIFCHRIMEKCYEVGRQPNTARNVLTSGWSSMCMMICLSQRRVMG
jgi:hypothetical protein